MKPLFRVNAALLVCYVVGTVFARPHLPERVPIHFGFGGAPNRWAEAGPVWFLLPAVAVLTTLTLRGAIWLAARSPDLWNLPEKERFLALSAAERTPIIAAMETFLAGVSIFVTLVFVALQAGIYATAVGLTDGLPWYVSLFVYGGIVTVLAAAVALNRRMAARIRGARGTRAGR